MYRARQMAALAALAALVLVAFYVGMAAYPQADDGWYAVYLKESPLHFRSAVPDRPLTAAVYVAATAISGGSPVALSAINCGLWLVFAWEAALLWRLLMPARGAYGWLMAALVLSPVLVQTQTITVSYDASTVFPTVLAYAGILLLWQATPVRLAAGLILCAVSVLFSEYALAAVLAAAALLAVSRLATLRTGAAAAAAALASYAVFTRIAEFGEVAGAKDPSRALARFDMAVPFNFLSHLWHCLFGRYALLLGLVQPSWDSKSTIAALGAGAAVVLLLLPQLGLAPPIEEKNRRLLPGLLAALAVGLLPFMLTGRNAVFGFSNSRFLIPVLPFALSLAMAGGLVLLNRRFHKVWLGALCFLCGYSAAAQGAIVVKEERWIQSAARLVRPYAESSNDLTVVLVRGVSGAWFELTAKMAATWPAPAARRLLVLDYNDSQAAFGDRTACQAPVTAGYAYRGIARQGRIGHLLLIDSNASRQAVLEPYCIPK